MPSENTLSVFVYLENATQGTYAGELSLLDEENWRFLYDRSYLTTAGALPVDCINLPLVKGPVFLQKHQFGAIRDSAPDYWGRLVFARSRKIDIRDIREFMLLREATSMRVGNLDFRESASSPESKLTLPGFMHLEELLEAARQVEANLPPQQGFSPFFVQGTSLGGARPKCSIEHENVQWVAKFPAARDAYCNARIEMATMMLAEKCGITVPKMQIVDVNGSEILLLQRFDRESSDSGNYTRKAFLSALSVLSLDETDIRSFSYLSLADVIRVHTPGILPQLFRRMVFNILCRNTDDHPRNHGFLYGMGGLNLAPAYDITPTKYTPGLSSVARQAMEVGSMGVDGTLENALSKVERFGLPRTEAMGILETVLSKFAAWEQCFNEAKVAEHDLEYFRPTFTKDWASEFESLR